MSINSSGPRAGPHIIEHVILLHDMLHDTGTHGVFLDEGTLALPCGDGRDHDRTCALAPRAAMIETDAEIRPVMPCARACRRTWAFNSSVAQLYPSLGHTRATACYNINIQNKVHGASPIQAWTRRFRSILSNESGQEPRVSVNMMPCPGCLVNVFLSCAAEAIADSTFVCPHRRYATLLSKPRPQGIQNARESVTKTVLVEAAHACARVWARTRK